MVSEHLQRLQERFPADISKKRLLVTGAVVLMLLFAGCGGNTNNGETTTATNTTSGETQVQVGTPATQSDDMNMGPETSADNDLATVTSGASQSSSESGLNVSVRPSTANTTNATLIVRATVDEASASEGIENVTVETGGGLDLSNVTLSNVGTAGIDEGGALPGNQTSESLAANVEQNIQIANDGQTLTIPFDGNESVASGDQVIAIVDGGVATNAPGTYSFNLTVDDGPSQTDRYNITDS